MGTGPADLTPLKRSQWTDNSRAHIKLWLYDHICTSFAIIVRKPVDHQRGDSHMCYTQYASGPADAR